MQQRRPRLGDVLDDYCPRERRVTNHVVVAMIEDDIKQTRCSTCDAEHEYKQARVPSPRRPKTVAAIQEGAESFEAKPILAPPKPADDSDGAARISRSRAEDPDRSRRAEHCRANRCRSSAASELPGEPIGEPGNEDEGPVHRRLIRATLPRPEGHVPERKEPEFTIRQPGSRGGGGGREVDGNSVSATGRRAAQRPGGVRPRWRRRWPVAVRRPAARIGSAAAERRRRTRPHDNGQRGGRPDGAGASNSRGPGQRGPGSGRRRGGR